MKLVVRKSTGEQMTFQIGSGETFNELKRRVQEQTGISLNFTDIFFKGNVVNENQKIEEYFQGNGNVDEDVNSGHNMNHPFDSNLLESSEMGNHLFSNRYKSENHTFLCCKEHEILKNNGKQNFGVTNPKCLNMPLCRLCAAPCTSEEMLTIFDKHGDDMKISDKINLCLPINVKMTDPLPKQICKNCHGNLNVLYKLADLCSSVQIKFEMNHEKKIEREKFQFSNFAIIPAEDNGENVLFGSSDTFGSNSLTRGENCPLCLQGALRHSSKLILEVGRLNLEQQLEGFRNCFQNNRPNYNDAVCFSNGSICKEDKLKILNIDRNIQNKKNGEDVSSQKLFKNRESDGIISSGETQATHFRQSLKDTKENESSEQYINEAIEHFCRICSTKFGSLTDILYHSFVHSHKGFYQCTLCIMFFIERDELINHLKVHEFMAENNCNHKVYNQDLSSCSLKQNSFELNLTKTCPQCTICLASTSKPKTHMKAQSKNRLCELCNIIFTNDEEFFKHITFVHSSSRTRWCDECKKVFRLENVVINNKLSHDEPRENIDTLGSNYCEPLNNISSSNCKKSFEKTCMKCKLCNEAFPDLQSVIVHLENKHELEYTNDDMKLMHFDCCKITKLFVCELCERYFTKGFFLNYHRSQHAEANSYECKFCYLKFKSLGEMWKHRNTHKNEKLREYITEFNIPFTYLCEYCESCFFDYIQYSQHLTAHYSSRQESYECQHCNENFPSLHLALYHRLQHENPIINFDEIFFCHYCNKPIITHNEFINHMKEHEVTSHNDFF